MTQHFTTKTIQKNKKNIINIEKSFKIDDEDGYPLRTISLISGLKLSDRSVTLGSSVVEVLRNIIIRYPF